MSVGVGGFICSRNLGKWYELAQAQSFLTQAQRLGKTAMQEVRQSVRALRADQQVEQPLEEAIADLAEEFRQVTGITPPQLASN